jgi:pyridoxal phosphate enzyme (YggS family)
MSSQAAIIYDNVKQILGSIPSDVIFVAAAKTRSLEEVEAAVEAGVMHIGYNYVQEAIPIIEVIGNKVTWHMIGHLQRNKAKLAVQYFDIIETVDSWRLAQALDRRCENAGRKMPVLVEINSGRESSKTGVMPEDVDMLAKQMSTLEHIHIEGLMTMGPRFGNPEDSRPYFKKTREAFERLDNMSLPNVTMQYLSMGMSNSYRIAVEEGANIIRIGTKLFGSQNSLQQTINC